MFELPHIDFASTDAQQHQRETALAIGNALQSIGFFAVINHGIAGETISDAYDAVEDFFALPSEVKLAYSRPELLGQRGYTGFAVERALGASAADLKEFYQVGRESNLWPAEVPQFESAVSQLFTELEQLAFRIGTAAARFLNLPDDFLVLRMSGGESVLRLIHYPPLPENAPTDAVRAAAHEDINFFTLLCGATAAGLELQTREGRWEAIATDPSQIIVDTGDMLQNLTGGLFRSTTHRVVNPAGDLGTPRGTSGSRYSMPFFVHPRSDVDLTPLASLQRPPGETRQFPSLTAGEFLTQRLTAIRPGS